MDTLKKILRDALQSGAHRIRLQSGAGVEVTGVNGTVPLAGAPRIDDAYLGKLFQFLFPNDKAAVAAKQLTKGALAIPNVGKLLLIAQPGTPSSLRIFVPPSGQMLFDADWQKLTSQTVAGGGGGLPGGMDLFGGTKPAPGLAPKPASTAAPAAGGFMPPGMAEVRAMPVAAPNTATPNIAPPGMAPPPSAPPLVIMQPDPYGGHAGGYAPGHGGGHGGGGHGGGHAPVVDDGPVHIDFEADSGAGDVSDGSNAIDPILAEMIRRKASDLHMTTGEAYCFRVDGEIARIGTSPLGPGDMAGYLLPIIPPRNRAEFAKINDTDFAYEIRGLGRFRVNVFRDRTGVGTVMRHIPSKILTSEQLGLPPAITKFCSLSKGLVVVTGPTGSGKSTTLAAMIDLINKTRHDHILTIEDPIEFVHPQQRCLVNQREVHKHTGSFSRALRAALREDPDIVLIGEMRDLETVAIAIETAETGHLVFGTLHTNTAVSTIDRVIDQFPADQQGQIRQMLASSLKGVVAQSLLKKKGGGRIAAHEILVVNDAVSAMIREGKNHMIPNHMQSQKADGNVLLTETLARLVKEDKIDADDAYRKAVDKPSLLEAFKRLGLKFNEAAALGMPAAGPVKKPA